MIPDHANPKYAVKAVPMNVGPEQRELTCGHIVQVSELIQDPDTGAWAAWCDMCMRFKRPMKTTQVMP